MTCDAEACAKIIAADPQLADSDSSGIYGAFTNQDELLMLGDSHDHEAFQAATLDARKRASPSGGRRSLGVSLTSR